MGCISFYLAPSLALPRKRERGCAAFGASLSDKHGLLPVPPAGEGWGGSTFLSTDSSNIS